MQDSSRLGPMWVQQLIHQVTVARDGAAQNMLLINPLGDFAKHHRLLINTAERMLMAAANERVVVEGLQVRAILNEFDVNPIMSKADALAQIQAVMRPGTAALRVLHDRTGTDWSAA